MVTTSRLPVWNRAVGAQKSKLTRVYLRRDLSLTIEDGPARNDQRGGSKSNGLRLWRRFAAFTQPLARQQEIVRADANLAPASRTGTPSVRDEAAARGPAHERQRDAQVTRKLGG
jgi:hypothetical protein